MTNEILTAVRTVPTPATAVFAVLADPATHAAIDGTGWVRDPVDAERLTGPGQIFRVAMYHPNHPDGDYEMANRVQVFDPPRAISWEPGYRDAGSDDLRFGGWVWRYDLAPVGESETQVTLSYDWSAVPAPVREHIQFPPFAPEYLDNSLGHLAELAVSRHASGG
ncbi:MAG: SRPBCC family protein [Pseudonocardia sp.]|nr:SRPBCC family protein [Pseudonocardia sp.]MBO0873394.1 SRPBCC family protein [Pseudonocardia sp.]